MNATSVPVPRATPANSRRFALALTGVLVATFAIRLVTALTRPDPAPISDATFYRVQGILLAQGHGFVEPFVWLSQHRFEATAFHPPLFSVVLAGVYRLGFHSIEATKVAVSVIGTATVLCIAMLGRRVGGDRTGLIAAGVAALSPNLWAPSGALQSEGLAALLVAGFLWSAYCLDASPRLLTAGTAGVLLGLAALTRPETVLLGPLVLVPLLWRHGPRSRRTLALVGLATLAAVVTIGPWTVRSLTIFEQPVIMSTNGRAVLGYANCDATYHGPTLGSWRGDCPARNRPGAFPQDLTGDESQQAAEVANAGVHYLRDHLGRFVTAVSWARIGRTWNLYRPFDLQEARANESKTRLEMYTGVFLLWALLALAVVALASRRREDAPPRWPLVMPAVTATVVSLLAYGTPRFRVIAEPSLVVLGALGADLMLTRLRNRAPVS